jgi:hypothetical protein
MTLEDEDTILPQMVQIIFHAILGYTAENAALYSMDCPATQLQKSQNSQQNTDVEKKYKIIIMYSATLTYC